MGFFRKDYTTSSDETLMRLLAEGDQRAFAALYDRHRQALFRYFHRMLWKDREKAEDCVQDFFMKIIRQPAAFDPKRRFVTWMYSVAHNMCKNEYRSNEIRKPVTMDEFTADNLVQHEPGADKQLDRKKFMEELLEQLDAFDENQKTTFLLRYEENLSIKEISEVLSCSEGTVKSRLFYTLRKLSERLKHFAPETFNMEER